MALIPRLAPGHSLWSTLVWSQFAWHRAQHTQIFRARVLQSSERLFCPHGKRAPYGVSLRNTLPTVLPASGIFKESERFLKGLAAKHMGLHACPDHSLLLRSPSWRIEVSNAVAIRRIF